MAEKKILENEDFVEMPATGEVWKTDGDGLAIDMMPAISEEIKVEFDAKKE